MKDLNILPSDLPVPIDDGACDHLINSVLPSISLDSTSGKQINISTLESTVVLFFYPMNGKPDSPPMIGWNNIPGARGCTPQVCSYRDNFAHLQAQGVTVFGISSQALDEQKEAHARLSLPYEFLNDSQLELATAMKLPTFEYATKTFIKRITMIVTDGIISKIFYPVFPPDKNVDDVLKWLEENN